MFSLAGILRVLRFKGVIRLKDLIGGNVGASITISSSTSSPVSIKSSSPKLVENSAERGVKDECIRSWHSTFSSSITRARFVGREGDGLGDACGERLSPYTILSVSDTDENIGAGIGLASVRPIGLGLGTSGRIGDAFGVVKREVAYPSLTSAH